MEKEEKEVKEEIKEEVKEPKKKQKKSNKVLTTVLIALLLIAFLGIGFAIGSTQLLKEANKVKDNNQTGEKETKKSISIYDERVTNSLKEFDKIGSIYGNKDDDRYILNINNATNHELIGIAIHNLEYNQINHCVSNSDATIEVSIDELNQALSKSVLNNTLTIDMIKSDLGSENAANYGSMNWINTVKENSVIVMGACGAEGPPLEYTKYEAELAEINQDSLNIYVKVAFAKTVENKNARDGIGTEYYLDNIRNQKSPSSNGYTDPVWSEFNTYKLTFKNINDKYYFISSELNN